MGKRWSIGTLIISILMVQRLASAQGRDGGPSGAFTYSGNATTASSQRVVKQVVERYQRALNAADFQTIRTLFTPDAIAEWNGKPTFVGVDAMTEPYATLFREAKFTTDFQYDAVDIYGTVGIVRTHHPKGQTEQSLVNGSKTLDFNREIFVLNQTANGWKIILYTFSTQPQQGVQ